MLAVRICRFPTCRRPFRQPLALPYLITVDRLWGFTEAATVLIYVMESPAKYSETQ